jgi:hypothetical protein
MRRLLETLVQIRLWLQWRSAECDGIIIFDPHAESAHGDVLRLQRIGYVNRQYHWHPRGSRRFNLWVRFLVFILAMALGNRAWAWGIFFAPFQERQWTVVLPRLSLFFQGFGMRTYQGS